MKPISMFRSILLLTPFLISNGSLHFDRNARIEKSHIEFSIKNAGMDVTGTVDGLEADITFDPKQPEKSSIAAKVSSASIQTGIGIRDKHLRKSDYFYTEKYPEILIRSTSISGGPHTFKGKFNLTIKNMTREVVIPFKRTSKKCMTHYHGQFEFNRLGFNLGEESPVLGDVVTVTIDLDVK